MDLADFDKHFNEFPSCKLDLLVVTALLMKGEQPCKGCNHDREECGGK